MTVTQQTDSAQRLVTAFDEFTANGSSASPPWLKRLREEAFHRFTELGFPTTKQEKWRFTSVKPLMEHAFVLAAGDAPTITPELLEPFLLPIEGGARLVFVNGRFSETLSTLPAAVPGVRIGSLAAAVENHSDLVEQHLGRRDPVDDNPFAALNTAFTADGGFLYVPAQTAVEQPVQMLFYTTTGDDPVMSHPRTLVIVEEGASVRLIETYAGVAGGMYFMNPVTEIVVGDNGRADCYRLQRESGEAYHVATTRSRQGRDSWYSESPIVFGGVLSRHDLRMTLEGEGGEGVLNGLYLTGGMQHVDHQTVIEHAVPHCDSHEYFNGILDERSHAVFNGRIIVRPGAQKTDSKQTNNNLLLSEDARADSQPQLEIYADDVRCTHGATLGPLDDNSLFYLESRGIGRDQARALLTYGFGVEILNRVNIEELRLHLDDLVRARLEAAAVRREA
jgi:Fe-S cluster assembly protein SufD